MEPVRNIVVIRPGALGDVLVTRGTLRFLRLAFPEARLTLLAPGERGRLFARYGWVDKTLDWESAECGWLFSGGERAPGERLAEAFAGAGLVLSFIDADDGRERAGEEEDAFSARVRDVAPSAQHGRFPAKPRDGTEIPVGRWLLDAAATFCRERGLSREREFPVPAACLGARFVIDAEAPDAKRLVMHPGSGSAGKNWPVENFARLAAALLRMEDSRGERFFDGLTVTAGEADGALGERLYAAVPGSRLAPPGGLAALAAELACARGYIGNDSGVSHLASSVMTRRGRGPLLAVIFGPSDARVWAPPGALVLESGPKLAELSAEAAARRIGAFFVGGGVFCLDKGG